MVNVVAIIVTFNPDLPQLKSLILSIINQVNKVLIVNNSGENQEVFNESFAPNKVEWSVNLSNLGVAAAYNQGVIFAKQAQASHLILFDQDSNPSGNMVAVMVDAWSQAKSIDKKVVAFGPNYIDAKGMFQSPFVKIGFLNLSRVDFQNKKFIFVDHIISSGCLIDMAYLDDVGGFEEKLFIDYVDTEWCLRARQKGYYLQGVASAHMEHNLGDSYLKVFSKNIPMHSPLRHYYLMRNGIWLMRQPWVGWHWRFLDCIRLFKIFIAFSLFAGEKQQRVKMMLLGVIDAIRGRMGKFED